ncbi:DNA mismatch repair protein MutS [Halobacteriales archaeon SW_7_68_16]|nr:MAG: DNA mismatch repair protein MutS [Halobacteriales archaeon SW_7_68_16]
MDLTDVPGIGEKTAAALADLPDPERALCERDVAAVARVDGISTARAVRIVRGAIRHDHGDPGDVLATDRAREIHRSLLSLLADRTVTEYGRKRVRTFYPSATRSRIDEVRRLVDRALDREPDPAVSEELAAIEPIREPDSVRVRDRCLATGDADRYSELADAFPELSVEIVEDRRDLADLARGYATVIVADERFAGIEIEGDVRVEPDAVDRPAEIAPERPLAFFAHNRDSILAAARVARRADVEIDADPGAIEAALDRLDADGSPRDDDELDRLETAIDDLDAAVSAAESVADDRLREAIRERDVTIEGADLLSLVERGAGVDSLLSRELADEYAAAVDAARDRLIDAAGLTDHEADLARRAFGDDPTFPVEADGEVTDRLRTALATARDRRADRLKRSLAANLADEREAAERLVRTALDLDVEYAIAHFAADFDCTRATLGDDGVSIEGGRLPLLDVPFEEVDPVTYAVSDVALLSGVNSGGKTSTLDLVAAVTVLAQCGLPVPAERVETRVFDAIHYHAKTQGTLDAGAFEATVREFAGIATGPETTATADGGQSGEPLVLVDELESITEPGASAVIIAGILEALHERAATAVFVSHLAGEIREACSFPVAVDGIEAVGLEDGELVVDRSPVKDHLARSTPELIVEKLAGESDRQFYDRLLEKFGRDR